MPFEVLAGGNTKIDGAFALDVLTGLSEPRKRLSSRWFYDDVGSELFRGIMASHDYYPTDAEREVLQTHCFDIASRFTGQPLDVVDLGAGDGSKTRILLDALIRQGVQVRYVPVDISAGAMRTLEASYQQSHPDLELFGVVGEYVAALRWLSEQDQRPRLVLFLGSNIGNFDTPRARGFLRRIWTGLRPGDHTFIGFDLKKDIEVLLAAYNDREGMTKAFNLNLLTRINRELGGDFDLDQWRHFGTYNVFSGAMESYLVSLIEQDVRIEALRNTFHFRAWEPIHTEFSYKYLPADIQSLADTTGYDVVKQYLDHRDWFCDSLWKVR